jgi:hypothetical protein
MTGTIHYLSWNVTPQIRYEALQVLQDNLGRKAAQEVVERAVYELSDRLCRLQQGVFQGDPQRVRGIATRLVAISDQIGLAEFSGVAAALVDCIDRAEATATDAVAARLIRLGESSMFQAVQFADMTGG